MSSTFYKQILRTQIPKVQKNSHVVNFFALMGSARKTLVKLTPGVKLINILLTPFSYKRVFHSFSLITVWLYNFWHKNIGTKAAH